MSNSGASDKRKLEISHRTRGRQRGHERVLQERGRQIQQRTQPVKP